MTPDMSGAASRAVEVATRPAVWVECRCGHEWQSLARDRMTIRCPECGTGQRVPYRTDANTGPSPEGYRPPPPPPRAPRVRPAPVWEPDDDPEDEWEPDEPPRSSLADWMRSGGRNELARAFPPGGAPRGGLAGILAAFGARTPAAPAPAPAPAPARRAAAPRPARPAVPNPPALAPTAPAGAASVLPVDPQTLPEREQRRRDDVCQMVRSLGTSLLVWYNQPPGRCEALDTNQPSDRQRCPGIAAFAVRFRRDVTEADAFTCAAHARPLAATADRAPYITATVYRLR
ncbi:hypothetical protein [Streptomyces sp. NRRL WC-3774]|uniref:hypothetical protein n=1 Tax=Streptomyces sp. NRRL WC-3774 TaxID=1463937 RepID=UPI000D1248CB|nr:hypothetical protein [Streptomyces sp. NRRL WC-3774]